MAPARSIQCIKRPPSRAASGLASLGSTISAISDCESRTGRANCTSSVMSVYPPCLVLRLLSEVRLQKTFRHLLDTRVVVPPDPGRSRQVKLQVAMLDRSMISFANITEKQGAGSTRECLVACRQVARSGDRKSHRIPNALR